MGIERCSVNLIAPSHSPNVFNDQPRLQGLCDVQNVGRRQGIWDTLQDTPRIVENIVLWHALGFRLRYTFSWLKYGIHPETIFLHGKNKQANKVLSRDKILRDSWSFLQRVVFANVRQFEYLENPGLSYKRTPCLRKLHYYGYPVSANMTKTELV